MQFQSLLRVIDDSVRPKSQSDRPGERRVGRLLATTDFPASQRLGKGEVGLFIFEADNNVRRDLDCYGSC